MSKTELRETFKKNLRNALYARDMTQKDFAKGELKVPPWAYHFKNISDSVSRFYHP